MAVIMGAGQGSQKAGMGHDFAAQGAALNKIVGHDLFGLMQAGGPELDNTANAQPAIVALCTWQAEKLLPNLASRGEKVDLVLGHSLGEYTALYLAGVLSFADAVKAVQYRGKIMMEAGQINPGTMFAITKLSSAKVQQACQEVSTSDSLVVAANFNLPTQTVISGHHAACQKAIAWLEANAGERFRATELKVSGAFHSPLMQPAAEKLAIFLDQLSFAPNQIAYIANVDGKIYPPQTDPNLIKQNLVRQVTSSVQWVKSLGQINPGQTCFELGPGNVLTNMARKAEPPLTVWPYEQQDTWPQEWQIHQN